VGQQGGEPGDIARLREAVTPGWRYIMNRLVAGWVPDAGSVVAAFAEELDRIRAGDRALVASGKAPSLQHAQATQAHRVMGRLAIWGQFEYHREGF
jgi:hypothetical protein